MSLELTWAVLRRIWIPIVLEVVFYFLMPVLESFEKGGALGFVLAFLPTAVAAFQMASAPKFTRSALIWGVTFWITAHVVWTIVMAIGLVSSHSIDKYGVAPIYGYLLGGTLFLPLVVLVSFLGALAARYVWSRRTSVS